MKKYGTYGNLNLSVLGFVLQMRVLIFSPNFVRVLLGWDGLEVMSFGVNQLCLENCMLSHKISFLGSTKMVNFQLLLGVNFEPW